jgi:hypothetical protein
MKPASTYLLLLFIAIVFSCTSCQLFYNEDEPKTELEKLPPITQSGKNTFGCLVNGKAYVVPNTMTVVAIYQGDMVQIHGSVDDFVSKDQNITIILFDPINVNEEYNLTNLPNHRAMFRNTKIIGAKNYLTCWYEYENTYKGKLILSKIDRINFIISGTFEFSTVNQECDTIRITDGRFDIQYIP